MTTQNEDFVTGELYLFHTSDADCPRETSLWGVVVRRTDDRTLLLKVCTRNPKQFVFGLQLPAGYRHCRPFVRSSSRSSRRNFSASRGSGKTSRSVRPSTFEAGMPECSSKALFQ